MASLRSTSRLLASSRPLFNPSILSRSYATVEPVAKTAEAVSASTPPTSESKTSTSGEPTPSPD
ncbi:hypothetical protein FQN54_007081, partial [Arachnomyces sp. PD_36]